MNPIRPKHLDLRRIRFPLPAVLSILHRISGALLFLALPWLLWSLQCSLASPETWAELTALFEHWPFKLALFVLLWAFLHHACAGVRYLAIDIGFATGLVQARRSAAWVLWVSLVLTLLLGVRLW